MPGLYPLSPSGQLVSVDSLLPIHILEGFYQPILSDKKHEIERLMRRVKSFKRDKYKVSRELKTLNL